MCVCVRERASERERETQRETERGVNVFACALMSVCVCGCVYTCTCVSAHAGACLHMRVCVLSFLKHHGSVPERKFGLEDGLTHEPSSLANEEMVEAALHWHGVHVKHFIPQVERHTENTWSTCQTLHSPGGETY